MVHYAVASLLPGSKGTISFSGQAPIRHWYERGALRNRRRALVPQIVSDGQYGFASTLDTDGHVEGWSNAQTNQVITPDNQVGGTAGVVHRTTMWRSVETWRATRHVAGRANFAPSVGDGCNVRLVLCPGNNFTKSLYFVED